jgi:HEAT repeat protein
MEDLRTSDFNANDPKKRAAAAESVAQQKMLTAIPEIVHLVQDDPDPWVRQRAALSLLRLGALGVSALFHTAFEGEQAGLLIPIISDWWRKECNDSSLLLLLSSQLLACSDLFARAEALKLIGHLGPKAASAVPDLIHIVKTDEVFRKFALDVLALIGPEATGAVPVVLEAISDESGSVRDSATKALQSIQKSKP